MCFAEVINERIDRSLDKYRRIFAAAQILHSIKSIPNPPVAHGSPTYTISRALAEGQEGAGYNLVLPLVAKPFGIETRRIRVVPGIALNAA